ncbi:MAG: sigma 54-interacting transcriptional regulator [Blastocatellia bacterium]
MSSDRAGKQNVDRSPVMDGLIGESELIRQVRQDIEIAARLDLSVLITGEPGTGKELVAQGIHKASRRAKKPFVDVNCAAFNSNLIESELFGHEKGAFTGAATNHDLLREVDEGRFRRDLYDRLCGYPIRTPALRERPTDIPILIRHYFPSVEIEKEALELLCRYGWPGNVRQLISTVERLGAKAGGRIITADHVRCEVDLERKFTLAPGIASGLLELQENETLIEYICRVVLTIYERERTRLGSPSCKWKRNGTLCS